MSIVAVRCLNRRGPGALNLIVNNLLRRSSSDDPCTQGPCVQPPKPKDPCSSSPQPTSTCPEPPPCPPLPLCPPSVCPPVSDPGNPCHYCPPSCPDPDSPDITNLKKNQCLFQSAGNVPTYLLKGTSDAIIFHLTVLLTFTSTCIGLFHVISMG